MKEIKKQLKIAVAQYPLLFPANEAEIHENMRRTEDMVRSIAQNETGLDLLLFCEECIDNVGMERMEAVFTGEVLLAVENFWKRMASIAGTHIVAGHNGKEGGLWRNYATCFSPDGDIVARYAKSHLYFAERGFYTPGDEPLVFNFKGWKVSMLICADLGFPEFSRLMAMGGCELFLAPSSWVYPHDELWILCNRLRAAENMAYLVSANHCGEVPNGQYKLGHSMAVNPKGDIIASLGTQKYGYFVANLEHDAVYAERKALPWLDWIRGDLYKKLYD